MGRSQGKELKKLSSSHFTASSSLPSPDEPNAAEKLLNTVSHGRALSKDNSENNLCKLIFILVTV